METVFDGLAFALKLEKVGFSREQAKLFAEAQVESARQQAKAVRAALDEFDEARRKELATKRDLRETKVCLQNNIRETELRLQKEIEIARGEIRPSEIRLLKWQIGIAVSTVITLGSLIAKGFGWMGF